MSNAISELTRRVLRIEHNLARTAVVEKPIGGGSGAPVDASYVVLGLNATLTNERALVGTTNQIITTDGGAGGNITLSLPQDIHTAASPTFAGLIISGSAITLNSIAYTLPPDNGDPGEVLTTNGAGVLTWEAGGGSVTGSGVAGRVALWSAASVLTSDADIAFDGSQLALAVQGATGGILVGGDALLYRSAADEWRTPDSLTIDSTLYLGSTQKFSIYTSSPSAGEIELLATAGLDSWLTVTAFAPTGQIAAVTWSLNSGVVAARLNAFFTDTGSKFFELDGFESILYGRGGTNYYTFAIVGGGVTSFNQADLDIDHRFAGTTATHLLFLDAGLDAIGINQATIAASAIFDVVTTTKGVLLPRMTEAQRDAIGTPAEALIVYNLDDNEYNYHDGTNWTAFGGGGGTVTGSGAAGRVAVWDGASSLTSDSAFTFNTTINQLYILGTDSNPTLYLDSSYSTTQPQLFISQASTGDAALRYAIGSTASYVTGIDNNDSDKWKLSYAASGSAVLGTDDYIAVTIAGQVQLPVQGSGGGLTIGGDVHLYRSAANVLTIPDELRVNLSMYAGSVNSESPGDVTWSLNTIAPVSSPRHWLFQVLGTVDGRMRIYDVTAGAERWAFHSDGGFNHLGSGATPIAFRGKARVAAPDYTVTNLSADRNINATGESTNDVRQIVATIITDLIAVGIFQ